MINKCQCGEPATFGPFGDKPHTFYECDKCHYNSIEVNKEYNKLSTNHQGVLSHIDIINMLKEAHNRVRNRMH